MLTGSSQNSAAGVDGQVHGLGLFLDLLATWGMLILIERASSGAVMMKITSSTSMTSIRAPC